MHRLTLILLSILSLSGVFNTGEAGAAQSTHANDHAVIQRRRIVVVRSIALQKEFPHKRSAVVTYPIVSGLNPAVLNRVRALFDFKNIFDYSLKEYREDTWLSEFTYAVNHNADYLLDITFTQEGSGAYPDTQSKHFLINLRDGHVLKASDVFVSTKLPQLAAAVDRKLQDELKQIDKENTESNAEDAEDKAIRREAQEVLKFEVKDLDEFSVGPKGITFLYDAGFPHAIQAFEPGGRYLFSYSELRPFIKLDGPLGQFVR